MILSNFTPQSAWAFTLGAIVITIAGCGNSGDDDVRPARGFTVPSGDAVVEVSRTRQRISGFGASSAWTLPNASDSLADQLFSVDLGIGLSLLRLRIAPSGQSSELATARKAVARGATVWAAPWSPPGEWKTNGDAENGGSLRHEHYEDWADRLAAFVASAAEQGVPLALLSAQNEPNWSAQWETCVWTPYDLTRFVGEHLGPKVEALGLGTRILAPETQDWQTLEQFANPMLADPKARAHLGAIAVHGYGGRAFAYAAPAAAGKELWVTELDDSPGGGGEEAYDPGMGSGLKVALRLHEDLTSAPVSAWHYWWIAGRGDLPPTNAALTDGTTLSRRAYVMGNYSKFVRPGFVRIDATARPQSGVMTLAFRDEPGTRLVVVATNTASREMSQRFVVSGATLESVTPWITSDELALEEQPPLPVDAGDMDGVGGQGGAGADAEPPSFLALLPPRSVTTFVGELTSLGGPTKEPEPAKPDTYPVVPRLESDETGCSCGVAGRTARGGAWVALLGAALAVAARCRSGSRASS